MWKLSYIIPLYKKGDPNNKANYRSISIISIMSRVFERILVKELTFYLNKNSLLSDPQFGFRSGKSVEIKLFKYYSQWITAIDEHKFIDNIYLIMLRHLIKFLIYNY